MIGRVVLIDDDEIALMLCELVIEQNGVAQEVVKLTNGKQGVEYFEKLVAAEEVSLNQTAPALVFLDLNMPIMNGWDFLDSFSHAFQDVFPDTRVVILSSSVDPQDLVRARQFDFVADFLSKPLSDEALLALRRNSKLQHLIHS